MLSSVMSEKCEQCLTTNLRNQELSYGLWASYSYYVIQTIISHTVKFVIAES